MLMPLACQLVYKITNGMASVHDSKFMSNVTRCSISTGNIEKRANDLNTADFLRAVRLHVMFPVH